MAKNKIMWGHESRTLNAACSYPATPASGDPVLLGTIPGVALKDEDADGNTVVDIGPAVYDLSVKAVDNSGNSAVALWDKLYYEAGQTPPVNKDSVSGVFFGYALETITAGSTDTIRVLIK